MNAPPQFFFSRNINLFLLVILLLASAYLRFAGLTADPPQWLEPTAIIDEGEWADPARGHIWFHDYFSDDLGTAYFVAPLYTFLLEGVYRAAGIGLAQTRSVSAVGTLLSIALVAFFLWRNGRPRAALWSVLLLTISPFYLAHSRVGFIEGIQTLAVIAAFVLWMYNERSMFCAFMAGLIAGAAVLLKPSAIYSSVLPILMTALLLFLIRRGLDEPPARDLTKRLAAFVCGGALLALALLLMIILPHWNRYWSVLYYEGGADRMPAKNILTMPGSVLMSLRSGNASFWTIPRFTPLIVVLGWMATLMIATVTLRHWNSTKFLPRLDLAVLLFALAQLACLQARTWKWNSDHYFVVVLPIWAMIGGLFLDRTWHVPNEPSRHLHYLARAVIILLLSVPFYMLAKPWAANALRVASQGITVGQKPGVSIYFTATLFSLLWLLLCAAIAAIWRHPDSKVQQLEKFVLPIVVLAGLIEAGIIIHEWRTRQFTFLAAQQAMIAHVPEGEIVLGSGSSDLFMPHKVRTCRRVENNDAEGIAHPPPNEDIWQRLKPRFILEKERFNFTPRMLHYRDLIQRGYRPIARVEIGPYFAGVPRYVYRLYSIDKDRLKHLPDISAREKRNEEHAPVL